jgi:hypothetical protein
MSITIAKIAANTATCSFQWGEDTVNVEYFPSQVTESTLAEMDKLSSTVKGDLASFNAILLKLIKSWDVMEDAENMFPVDADHLAMLPLKFRMVLVRTIVQDIRPNA